MHEFFQLQLFNLCREFFCKFIIILQQTGSTTMLLYYMPWTTTLKSVPVNFINCVLKNPCTWTIKLPKY